MKSVIISLPRSSPLLFPILTHPYIHKYQPVRHALAYIRSLFIGIDIPLPPIQQAIITTHKHQHKLHLSYTYSDRPFLFRTQQLSTNIGLLCQTLDLSKPTSTSTSASTSTSMPTKHVIDLELLPDKWEDEFLQPGPVTTSSMNAAHVQQPKTTLRKPRLRPKKLTANNQSHPTATTIATTATTATTATRSTVLPQQHFITYPTITFAEWEKHPQKYYHLPYTFCIQCEKPIHFHFSYEHHQTHLQPPTTTTATSSSSLSPSTPTSTSTSTSTSTTLTPTRHRSRLMTYTCPFSHCNHKFDPNARKFLESLNAHIEFYHDYDNPYAYSY